MSNDRLAGKRILVTSADTYMGPAIVELFRAEGAEVISDNGRLVGPEEPDELVASVGELDALIVNLDLAAYGAKTSEIEDQAWLDGFDSLVHPLMRIVRAVSPNMIERRAGNIVAVTSSAPLRRMSPQAISYVTARSAQNAFVRSAGHDLAKSGVRLNAIAQNFIENETYYPPEVLDHPRFQEKLKHEVPARRIGQTSESAELALFLASDLSSFIFGQIISQDGGWS